MWHLFNKLLLLSVIQSQNRLENLKLVNRLKAKDQSALGALYEKYSGSLLHIIAKIIQPTEAAEEILQDVFVKIWEKIDQYDEDKGRLFTWMVQIARNTAIDTARLKSYQKKDKTDSIDILVNKDELNSELPMIEDIGLKRVVEQMDESHRELINYLYFRDFTQKETSEALNIPLGTVKTRARSAINALRKALGSEFNK